MFAEQKQLAAFSDHSPADRRRLVMQLLGITPLDSARDLARPRARRQLTSDHDRLRAMLADVAVLTIEAADALAAAEAAEAFAADETKAAGAAEDLERARRRAYDIVEHAAPGARQRSSWKAERCGSASTTSPRSVEARRLSSPSSSDGEPELATLAPSASGAADLEASLGLLVPARTRRELPSTRW